MSISTDRTQIALQEKELVFPAFDAHAAWTLGNTLRTLAETRKHPVVIDIRKFGDPDQQLFFTALPGTTPDNARWVLRKSRIVARFHRSSYAAGLYLEEQGTNFAAKYSLPDEDYATHGGAFPITVAGTGVIGAVTVSGLPQRQDHELVIEALCTHLNLDHKTYKLP
jgi:uncharacterized protein (UPF0303 family)